MDDENFEDAKRRLEDRKKSLENEKALLNHKEEIDKLEDEIKTKKKNQSWFRKVLKKIPKINQNRRW